MVQTSKDGCVSLDELVAMNNEDEFLHFERIMKALQQKK